MTTMTATPIPASRPKTIILWVLRTLMAGLFLFAATMKLTGQPMMVAEFGQIGLGQWFRYITGLIEIAGGIGLLIPRVSVFGAMLLLAVDIGAFVAQVTVLHVDWIHTIVVGLILVSILFLQRKRIFPNAAG